MTEKSKHNSETAKEVVTTGVQGVTCGQKGPERARKGQKGPERARKGPKGQEGLVSTILLIRNIFFTVFDLKPAIE
jgi:hypothetical protein